MRREIESPTAVALVGLLMALAPPHPAAAEEPVQAIQAITATRESMALTYPEGPTISIEFQGTSRLPRANGEAKVERKKGMTEIEIELDEMKPASFFGGDYNTYVLWTVSPESHVDNVGEFILEGNRSKLNVSTPLETFGMFITAEPHFLVETPSRFVVLENTRPRSRIGNPIQVSQIRYRGFDGEYDFEQESLLELPETKGEIRSDLGQAYTAVELAERAGAEQYAGAALSEARAALERAEGAARRGVDRYNLMLAGHEVVRLATEAEKLAEERAFQAALDRERQQHVDETARLEQARHAAQTEAERERLRAQQQQLQVRMEQNAREEAQQEARAATQRALEEERMRRAAELRAEAAQAEANQMASAKSAAETAAAAARAEAERAAAERERARAEMQRALSQLVETRETARGLILNLPDVLFDFNKATLRPHARELLSKIAGILQVAPDYGLQIEGHTDSIGSEAYNLKLSERRADAVRDYLASAGVPARLLSIEGFGEDQPVASNSHAEGRQQNRRVEIVIEDKKPVLIGGRSRLE